MAGILLGVVLVAFCAVGVAAYTASIGHRRAVLVIVRPVNAGSVIRDADLGEARLPSDPKLRPLPAGARRSVVGRVAAVNLVPGSLLVEAQLTTGLPVDPDHAVVGLALKAGQFPTGLRPLDTVTVIETTPASNPGPADGVVVVDGARVVSIDDAADGQTTIVSVLVPRPVAPAVAGAAARDQISLVLVAATAAGPTSAGAGG